MRLALRLGRHIAQGNFPVESSSGLSWRALVGVPSILLADEPTGNLDFRTGEMIFELLERLHRSHTLTSVFVTHNMSFARRCDRIMRMDGGALVPGSDSTAQPCGDE